MISILNALTQDQIEAVIKWVNKMKVLSGTVKPKRIHDAKRQAEIIVIIARYLEAAEEPQKELFLELASYIEHGSGANNQPEWPEMIKCDRCGCHPSVIYTTPYGRVCMLCRDQLIKNK